MIQASQAEKNRAAAASKYKKEVDKGGDGFNAGAGTLGSKDSKRDYNNKVYVGGLVDVLNQISESEIRMVI